MTVKDRLAMAASGFRYGPWLSARTHTHTIGPVGELVRHVNPQSLPLPGWQYALIVEMVHVTNAASCTVGSLPNMRNRMEPMSLLAGVPARISVPVATSNVAVNHATSGKLDSCFTVMVTMSPSAS